MHTSCLTPHGSAPTDRPGYLRYFRAFGLFQPEVTVSSPSRSIRGLVAHGSARRGRAGRPSAWPAEGLHLPVTGAMRPPGGGNAAMPPPGQVRLEPRRVRSYAPFSGSLVQYLV